MSDLGVLDGERKVAPPQPKTGDLLEALNHSVRRAILRLLVKKGEVSSAEARQVAGNIEPSLLNYHLRILLDCGTVLKHKRRGFKHNFYSLTEATQARWFRTVLQLSATDDR